MTLHLPVIGKVRKPLPWVIGLVAVGFIGTTGIAVSTLRTRTANQANIETLTIPVESQSLTVRITARGEVEPIRTVNLSPRTTDILKDLYVEQGDRVEAGQIIAQMKSDNIEADLTQAKARVAQAEAQLAQLSRGNRPQEIAQSEARVEQWEARVAEAESRLKLAEDRVQRNQFLQGQGAVSLDDLDAATREFDSARASLEQNQASLREARKNLDLFQAGSRIEDIQAAEAQLAEARGALQAAEVRMADTVIQAPFAGVILQTATVGDFVSPTTAAANSTAAIVTLADDLEILAEVPEIDINQIQVGQTVEIVADAFPDKTFEGRVRLIEPQAFEEQTRRDFIFFKVRVELITGQDELKSGMRANIAFLGDEVAEAMVVPTVAVVTLDGETGVLVPDRTKKVRFRPVTIGSTVGNQTQILDGVEKGDRIFIDLPKGQKLENLNFGNQEESE